jgi:hypothetical protein
MEGFKRCFLGQGFKVKNACNLVNVFLQNRLLRLCKFKMQAWVYYMHARIGVHVCQNSEFFCRNYEGTFYQL